MFINFASSEVYGQDVGNDEFTSSYTHFFVAATEKPKTMTEYNETGLIGVVCRHGTPLRYMNMYQGERMEQTYQLVSKTIASLPGHENWGLMYDIGCRFKKWLRRQDPTLAKHLMVCIMFSLYSKRTLCNNNIDKTKCFLCICLRTPMPN